MELKGNDSQMLPFPSVIPERPSKASLGREERYSPLKIRGMVGITYDRGETEFSVEIALKICSASSGRPFLKNFYDTRKQAELHHLIFEKPLSVTLLLRSK